MMTTTTATQQYEPDKFSEIEYKRELDMHEIKIRKGQTAKETYAKHAKELLQFPKSGVFRDFKNYGVYPAKVQVVTLHLTIPFLVRFLSAFQVREEIINQQFNDQRKKEINEKFKQEGSKEKLLRSYPSLGDCYTLIQLIQRRYKESVRRSFPKISFYTPPLRQYMTIINGLRYFNIPLQRKLLRIRREYTPYFTALIPVNIISNEIAVRNREDPRHWNASTKQLNSRMAEELIVELVNRDANTHHMREIMRNLRKITFRHEFYNILERLRDTKEYFFPSIRIVISSSDERRGKSVDILTEL